MTGSKLKKLSLCIWTVAVLALVGAAPRLSYLKLAPSMASASTQALENSTAALSSEADSKDLTLLTKEVGIKFALTCTSLEFIGLHLESKGKLNTGAKAKFTGCEAYGKGTLEEALGCHIHSSGQPVGTIETGKGKGELVLHELAAGGKELLTKLEPEAGSTGTFATFLTEGCVIPEANPIHGTLFLKDGEKSAEVHLVKHLVEAGPLTSLWVGADNSEHLETSIDGSSWVKLGGEQAGLRWGAKDEGPQFTWVVLDEG